MSEGFIPLHSEEIREKMHGIIADRINDYNKEVDCLCLNFFKKYPDADPFKLTIEFENSGFSQTIKLKYEGELT